MKKIQIASGVVIRNNDKIENIFKSAFPSGIFTFTYFHSACLKMYFCYHNLLMNNEIRTVLMIIRYLFC